MTIPYLNHLLERWRGLQPRERLVITAGAIVLLILLYVILLVPLQQEVTKLRVDVPRKQAQLAIMRVQAKQVMRLRAGGRRSSGSGNLLSRLEQSANARGLRQHITRMEPEGSNGARLSLDGVNFNTLVSWLADLQAQTGVRVEKANMESQPPEGSVNARLVLRGAGK